MNNKHTIKPSATLVVGAIFQLFLGIIYIWSIFVMPVSECFQWDINKVKLTSSFMLSMFVVGILIGGQIQVKISTQKTSLIGGLLLSAGMLSSAFLPKDLGYLIYVTYGIIGGFGVGLSYNAIVTTAQRNFPHKRGLATGISVCAFGFSTVIFAPLVDFLIKNIELRNTFILLGCIVFIVTLCCFSFIRMPSQTATQSALSDKRQYTTKEILKTKQFYFITLSLMFGTAAYFILNPSFKTLAVERNLSASIATVLVMITGVANALGRLGFPILSDKIGREKAAFITIAITALCSVSLIFVNGIALIFVIAIIASCYGGFSGVYPVLTGDYFGLKNIGSNYGAVMVGFAMSALLLPIALSFITNITVKFIVLACIAGIGAILTLLLKREEK